MASSSKDTTHKRKTANESEKEAAGKKKSHLSKTKFVAMLWNILQVKTSVYLLVSYLKTLLGNDISLMSVVRVNRVAIVR